MTASWSNRRAHRLQANGGFTIVEMLLVIGIIMLLMAIMLPSLSAVQKRSRKMVELNHLRQVGMAWNMYGSQHNDAALPGFLEETGTRSVQKSWRVRYEYPVLPNQGTGPSGLDPTIPDQVSGPWTWRLANYFDYNPEVLWGYRMDATNDVQALVDNALQVAYEPAFGYNAYYVGGWWRVTEGENLDDESSATGTRARMAFWDARVDNKPANVVVRTLSTMARPSELVIFSSSTQRQTAGVYPSLNDDLPGSHMVTPPRVARDRKWVIPALSGIGGGGDKARATSDRYTVEVFDAPAYVPLGRHNRFNAILHGDGSTDTVVISDLFDQRRWVNGLDTMADRNFSHDGTYWP